MCEQLRHSKTALAYLGALGGTPGAMSAGRGVLSESSTPRIDQGGQLREWSR
jgi:hypothetical protein